MKNSAKSNIPELILERAFDAPRELVFDAWIDEDKAKRWSAPKGYTIPKSEGEARAGGKWRATMRSDEGKDIVVGGVYREVLRPERIVSTHYWLDERGKPGPETLMIITFAERGDQTEMTFRQSGFESREDRDGHEGGWKECFDKLEELVESEIGAAVRR